MIESKILFIMDFISNVFVHALVLLTKFLIKI